MDSLGSVRRVRSGPWGRCTSGKSCTDLMNTFLSGCSPVLVLYMQGAIKQLDFPGASCQVVELSDQWKQVPEVKWASVEWSELTARSKGLSLKGAGLKKGGFIAPRP